jgi:hypothetical protein
VSLEFLFFKTPETQAIKNRQSRDTGNKEEKLQTQTIKNRNSRDTGNKE